MLSCLSAEEFTCLYQPLSLNLHGSDSPGQRNGLSLHKLRSSMQNCRLTESGRAGHVHLLAPKRQCVRSAGLRCGLLPLLPMQDTDGLRSVALSGTPRRHWPASHCRPRPRLPCAIRADARVQRIVLLLPQHHSLHAVPCTSVPIHLHVPEGHQSGERGSACSIRGLYLSRPHGLQRSRRDGPSHSWSNSRTLPLV